MVFCLVCREVSKTKKVIGTSLLIKNKIIWTGDKIVACKGKMYRTM